MNRYHFDKIRHVHSLDDKPLMGCSTIVNIINKPMQWWVAEQTLKPLGWSKYNKKVNGAYKVVPDKERLPDVTRALLRITEMKPKTFLDLLDSCYSNHSKKKDEAADKGTERHEVLAAWIQECMEKHNGAPSGSAEGVEVFCEWAKKNVKKFLWSEIHTYSEELWAGGIADVGWEDLQGRVVAGDFKSSKDIYFSQFLQVAGYDIMLSESGGLTAEGEKIFTLERPIEAYCVAPFGQDDFDPIILDHVEDFKAAFKSSVHLYKLNQLFSEIKKSRLNRFVEGPKTGTLAQLLAA